MMQARICSRIPARLCARSLLSAPSFILSKTPYTLSFSTSSAPSRKEYANKITALLQEGKSADAFQAMSEADAALVIINPEIRILTVKALAMDKAEAALKTIPNIEQESEETKAVYLKTLVERITLAYANGEFSRYKDVNFGNAVDVAREFDVINSKNVANTLLFECMKGVPEDEQAIRKKRAEDHASLLKRFMQIRDTKSSDFEFKKMVKEVQEVAVPLGQLQYQGYLENIVPEEEIERLENLLDDFNKDKLVLPDTMRHWSLAQMPCGMAAVIVDLMTMKQKISEVGSGSSGYINPNFVVF